MSSAYTVAASRRSPAGFLLIVAMHVAAVLVIDQALGLRLLVPKPPPPLVGSFEPDRRPLPPDEPMPPRVASNEHTRIDDLLPPDLGPLDTGDDAEPLDLAPPDVGGSADPVPRIPVQQAPTLDARHPLTQPAYPTGSIRMEETGVVELELRIGLDGRVRDARVLRSSGHARLDRAAIDEALRAWRFKPATLDGQPIEGVYRIKVTFRLDDR